MRVEQPGLRAIHQASLVERQGPEGKRATILDQISHRKESSLPKRFSLLDLPLLRARSRGSAIEALLPSEARASAEASSFCVS